MKIRTGEIVDKNKDKNVVSSVKLSKGTRVGTLKLTVNGEEQDSVPVKGLGGGSSTVICGSVDTKALWDAINKKVDVDFFKNLFTVYDSSDIEIATNTYARKPDNLKISVGTWTEEYLSALGKNSEGGGGGGGVGTVIGIALGTGTTPMYPDDDTGIVTLPAYPNKVSQLANDSGFVTSSTLNNYVTSSYLTNNFYTKAQADSKYMTIAAFESLFNALDSNGDKINHPYSSGVDSIKALVGLWTEEYLSALGQNSEGGSSGGGSVNAIKVGTNPDTYLDPVEGIIDMSNYVTTAAQRTLWTNSAHTHSNKAVLDNITAGQVAAWNNMAAIMGEDQDDIINKWNEVVAFLSTYTEADTLANLLSNKLDVEFFRKIFTVYDEDGNIIVPNTYTQVADNLKILVGAWTEEYLSALGKNSEEGGGGTGTVTSVKIASNPDVFIDPVDGIIDMSSYAATWNNKQNAISDLATIRSNASNGNTAYSWGNHANAGYAQASNTVSNVAYNTTGKKLTKTINGNTTDIVSASTIVTDGGGAKASTTITAGNGLTGGGDLSSNRTINVVSANAAITVNADNIKLNVINDYTTTTNNTIIPLAAARGKDLNDRLAVLESWFEVDSDGNVKTKDMPNGTHRGFYTESFVSALGSNSDGGGSSTFDEEQMWTALQSTSGTYATTKIATSHIPDMASTYGYLKASSLNGYATQTWVNQQGFLTTHQSIYALTLKAGGTAVTTFTPNSADASLDFVAGTNISLTRGTNQITIANTYSYTLPLAASGTRGGVQIGYSESNSGTSTTRNYAVKLSSEKMYVNVPWTDTTYKLTLNGTTNGASGGTSLGSFYAPTAVGTDGYVLKSSGSGAPSWVAQSTLSVGTAAKLGTGTTTYTAWGQTYWSSGVPQSISGNMTSVGSITPSANGNNLGTTSARFNIYGTAGNFSGNVSIGGTLGVTGAATLSSTLSVASGITLTTTKKIYFGDTSHYLELDSTGFHFSHGVYSDSFVSALGANSSGGGSGTFDEEAMWEALGTTSTAKVIASNHIPNLSASKITSGTLAAARIPNLSWNKITSDLPTTLNGYGVLDDANSKYYALYGGTKLNNSLSSTNQIDLNDILSVGNYYCSNSADAAYITNKPINSGSFRLWVSAPNGTSANYRRQRFQALNQDAIYERYAGVGSGGATSEDWQEWHLVQNNLANYASASSLNNYLPLSGGTMTGFINFDSSNCKIGITNSAKTNIDVGWDWDSYSGAGIGLRSASYTSYPGSFSIYARTSSANSYALEGRATGELLWGSNSILHAGNYSDYALPLTGGTLYKSTTDAPLYVKTSNASGAYIGFQKNDGTTMGFIGVHPTYGAVYVSSGSTYPILRSDNYSSYALPLSGGTLTGGLTVNNNGVTALGYNAKFDVDSSRELGYDWLNTSGTKVASVTYHNTAQNIIINPVGSSNTYSDAVGKYSLFIGNNKLTYNTYPILHSNNYNSYALPLTGGVIKNGSNVNPLNIDGDGDAIYLYFRTSGTNKTTVGWWNGISYVANEVASGYPRIGVTDAGNPEFWTNSASNKYAIHTSRDGAKFGGSIEIFSDGTDWSEGVRMHLATDKWCGVVMCGSDNTGSSGTSAKTWSMHNNDGSFYIAQNGSSSFTNGISCVSGTWAILSSGNVGIGTKSPSQKLHVAGSILTTANYFLADGVSGMCYTESGKNIDIGWNWSNISGAGIGLRSSSHTSAGQFSIYARSSSKNTNTLNGNATGSLTWSGSFTASGEVTASSDERKKNIISETKFNVKDIASTRSVLYEWNDGRSRGTEKKVYGGSIAQDWLGKADSFLMQDEDGFYSINYGALALCSAITIARDVVKHEDEITRLKKEVVKLRERIADLEERRA